MPNLLSRAIATGLVLTAFTAMPVHAVNVNLSGLITSQCVLSLSTPGTPAASKDGKRLGSTERTPGNLSQRRIACTRMYEIEIARMLSEIDLLRLAAE